MAPHIDQLLEGLGRVLMWRRPVPCGLKAGLKAKIHSGILLQIHSKLREVREVSDQNSRSNSGLGIIVICPDDLKECTPFSTYIYWYVNDVLTSEEGMWHSVYAIRGHLPMDLGSFIHLDATFLPLPKVWQQTLDVFFIFSPRIGCLWQVWTAQFPCLGSNAAEFACFFFGICTWINHQTSAIKKVKQTWILDGSGFLSLIIFFSRIISQLLFE